MTEANPNAVSAEAAIRRGQTCMQAGDYGGAIAHFSQALQQVPAPETFLKRAAAYLAYSNPSAAIIDAEQAVRLKPTLPIAHHILAKAYALVGDRQDAIAAYKAAAHAYLDAGDSATARQCIQAIDRLRQAIAAPPSMPTLRLTSADDFLQQTVAKLEQHQFAAAITDLDWFLQLEPDHADALCKRAYAYAKVGRSQQAVQDMTRAVQLAPADPDILKQRGIIRLALGDARGAVQEFSALLQTTTNQGVLLMQRGNAYSQLKQWDDAFKDYANALGYDPENPSIYAARAAVWDAMGDRDEAIQDYQQAATLWLNAGNWPKHQQMQQRLAALQNPKPAGDSAGAAIAAPIKTRAAGHPVIEVTINDRYRFDMVLDASCGITIITPDIARTAGIIPGEKRWCYTNDGGMVELPMGQIPAIAVGEAVQTQLTVAIAIQAGEPVLGQDFLSHYDVQILSDRVELHPK
jgi:tetratricopeptide (TPR) repeat protein